MYLCCSIFVIISLFCSNAIKFTHEGKVGIKLHVVQEPSLEKSEESHQKMKADQPNVSVNGYKEEKYISTAQNCCDSYHQDYQSHADHPTQNHQLSDECRSPVKSSRLMNGDTEEHSHSTEKTVWIRCDVYDTGIGIPGIFQICL